MSLRLAPATSTHTDAAEPHQVLDPCHLGRPMHLLTQFNTLLHDDLSVALRRQVGQRREGALYLGGVKLQRLSGGLRAARWLHYPSERGRIGFHADRSVLLALLACRYDHTPRGPFPTPDTVPETTTEERLCQSLGQAMVRTVLGRINAGLRDSLALLPRSAMATGQPAPPAVGAWLLKATVHTEDESLLGHVLFALDESCMDTLLNHLSPPRAASAKDLPSVDLPDALRLTLRARLVEQQLPLSQILDLKPGQVIPVRLAQADVVVNHSVVFQAAVVEHQGKLCLTSFTED